MRSRKPVVFAVSLLACGIGMSSCAGTPAPDEADPAPDRSVSSSSPLTELAADDFDRPNEVPLSDQGKWRGNYTHASGLQVVANSIQATSTSEDNVMSYVGIATPNDQYARITLKTLRNSGTTSFPGVLLRWGEGSDFDGYDCRVAGPSASRIATWVRGKFKQLSWQNGTSWETGDDVQCEIEGTSIRMYRIRDGIKTLAATASDDSHSSGSAGVIIFSGGNIQDVQLDEVKIGRIGGSPTPPKSHSHLGCLLPLGDSITQANGAHLGYRYRLWEKLKQAGIQLNFVGSMHSNYTRTPNYPDPTFDRDHEGHWGWRADRLLQSLPGWLSGYTPGIALVHVGSNDVFQGQSNETTISEIAGIIDVLRGDNPSVAILLAQLIPPADAAPRQQVIDLNRRISELTASKSTTASPVTIVNQFAGFDPAADTYDGVHPNESGERKMADKWYAAMQTLIADGLTDCP